MTRQLITLDTRVRLFCDRTILCPRENRYSIDFVSLLNFLPFPGFRTSSSCLICGNAGMSELKRIGILYPFDRFNLAMPYKLKGNSDHPELDCEIQKKINAFRCNGLVHFFLNRFCCSLVLNDTLSTCLTLGQRSEI